MALSIIKKIDEMGDDFSNKLNETIKSFEESNNLFFEEHFNALKQAYLHSKTLEKTLKKVKKKHKQTSDTTSMEVDQLTSNLKQLTDIYELKSFTKIELILEYLLKKTNP